MKKIFKVFITILMFFTLTSCENIKLSPNNSSNSNSSSEQSSNSTSQDKPSSSTEIVSNTVSHKFEGITFTVNKDGRYTSKYEVAIYINYFHKLPSNYYRKNNAPHRTVENKVAIGGDYFGNREGKLPSGRSYTEVDIIPKNQEKSYSIPKGRGVHRIVFSNKYEIYYTSNHYKSFDRIYFN